MSAVCRTVLFVATIALVSKAQAQERCGADLFEKAALQKNPHQREQFELWMKNKIAERNSQKFAREKINAVMQIPVVVHIVHNGEQVGTGSNLSDAQVQSQIRVLNEDYKRLNDDASKTPSEFAGVASSIDLQFILAKQDPDGLPTSGITRSKGSKSGYLAYDDNAEIKSYDYWPSKDYFNIWVTNLQDGYLGVAQYPITDLPGTNGSTDELTDGIVIHYKAFGSNDDGAFSLSAKYNLGRTTTHETGHYFGLLHIFGNAGSCTTTDYVDDTPVQKDKTYSCPTGPLTQCEHHVMYQNYMDYTDDACMNLFTAGQIDRIQTVLDNSPRRTSLLTSHGLVDPVILDLDLEAKNVAAPIAKTCGDDVVPKVTIRNRGNTTITSARISFSVNGSTVETKDFNFNLVSFASTTLSFTTMDFPEPSANTITYEILQVNGTSDDDVSNNTTSLDSDIMQRIVPPALEPFDSFPLDWQVVNTDSATTWAVAAAGDADPSNTAMYMDFYDYQTLSARDRLITPFYAIPSASALLKFKHAYAIFQNTTTESLRVLISVGCGSDPVDAVEIYEKTGNELATVPAQDTEFIPSQASQWRSDGISLVPYAGQNVQLIFEATNQNGNNLYIDNVQITIGDLSDMKIVSVVAPGPVFCESKAEPVITVQNLGSDIVDDLTVVTTVNGAISANETLTNLAMKPGDIADLKLHQLNLAQTNNTIIFDIENPDAIDDVPDDNTTTVTRIFNSVRETIPLRQNFDENVSNWIIYSETGQLKWQPTSTAFYKNALVYEAFSNPEKGDESWFVSPVLDFTRASEGSLLFTTSYARRTASSDHLRVLVSEDCGVTYNDLIFESAGVDLANTASDTEWIPGDSSDWKKQYVSTNDFAGKDKIRFAFVATNDNGNDIYLDNIEFFMEDTDEPARPEELFVVYNSLVNPTEFYISFNLPAKQDARLTIFNSVGQLLIDSDLPDTLNQTYTINLNGQAAGVYIARLQTPSLTGAVRVFIGR